MPVETVELNAESVEHRGRVIQQATAHWRDRCLLNDGSSLSDSTIWTAPNIQQLIRYFVERPDASSASFFSKLKEQLGPASPEAKKLAAEMLWVMYLIVSESAIRAETKRLQIRKVWSWSGEQLPDNHPMLGKVLASGVAHPGTAYNTQRWRELQFFIRWIERWKAIAAEERKRLLSDGWAFARWLDQLDETRGRQLRHILLYLLFPDRFDPIASGQHKRDIVDRWLSEVETESARTDLTTPLRIDQAVDAIRRHLQSKSGGASFNFYCEPWASEWRPDYQVDRDTAATLAEPTAQWVQETFEGGRVWAMAAGEGARFWPEFRREGLIALGAEELGDLSEYDSKELIRQALSEARGVENPIHDALAAWQFAHEMKVGDHILAKQGRSKLLGWGVVTSEYRYEPTRSEYQNVRDVEWRQTGTWDLPVERRITNKTLTDFTLYTGWLETAIRLLKGGSAPSDPPEGGYSLDRATKGLFMSPERFSQLVDLLGRKKNVILQGPPGVGKSFIARRLAYRLMDAKDDSRIQMVQFHQAYAYEDFVQGYRPVEGGGFQLKDGVFYDFCRRASRDRENKYVFIIDEINRGNLPRILGELMLLIEADKRSPEYAVQLTYATADSEPFFVADNVYILGMMNTADRSLAMVDYALRRRFGFETLQPEYQNERFTEYLIKERVGADLVAKIEERMTRLNEEIAADQKNLGPGFEIGHSYFVPGDEDSGLDDQWYERVIRTEVGPLLREYWFDQPTRVDELIEQLLQ